MINKIIWKSI